MLKIEAFFLLAKLTSCVKACAPPRTGLCLWRFKFWLFFPFSFGRKCPKKYYKFLIFFQTPLLISASCSMWGLSENFLKRFLHIVIFTNLLRVYKELVNTLWGRMMSLHICQCGVVKKHKRLRKRKYLHMDEVNN